MFKSIALPCQIIALAFLILSLVTPPLTTSIALAVHNNYKYGVFGYCLDADCSSVKGASYTVSSLDSDTTNWAMGDSSRDTFAKILILSPVSCFLVLVSLFLNFLSHWLYNKGLLLITMVLAILAFLSTAVFTVFTFLTFYPNITWASWIQIGSSVLTLLAIILLVLEIVNFGDDDMSEDDDSSFHKDIQIRKVSNPFGHDSALPDPPKSSSDFKPYVATKQFSAPSSSLDPSSRSNTLNNTSSYNPYSNDYQPRTAPVPPSNTAAFHPPISTIASSGALRTNSITSQRTATNDKTTNSIEQINLIPPATQSDQILKLPNISNPYSDNTSGSSRLDEYDQTSNENDIRLSNLSPTVAQNQKQQQQPQIPTIGESPNRQSTVSSDSEFTSVSQREINPNYYRGYQPKNGPQHAYFANSQPYYTNNSQPQQHQPPPIQQQGQYYDTFENPQDYRRTSDQSAYANPYADPQRQSTYSYDSSSQQQASSGTYLGNSANQILEANPDMTAGRIGSRPGVRKYGLHRLASKNINTTGGLNGQVQARASAQAAYGNTAAQLAGSGAGAGYTNEFKKRQQLQSKGFVPGHGGTAGMNGMGGPYGGV